MRHSVCDFARKHRMGAQRRFPVFGGMMVLQLVSVKTLVVKTKGVPIAEIEKKLGFI